ncbi:MAG: DUF169 domain-containing protein [Deltaproteobacteria bacterium]|jgi:hypothetical protein|nr:DUF169 domain-containing protein [Deltaproteobacteria bacterium]
MNSLIADALNSQFPPLGIRRTMNLAPKALTFKKRVSVAGGWGCAMALLGQAFQGRTVAFSSETCRCPGATSGLGLKPSSFPFPGGELGTLRLLSCGNQGFPEGQKAISELAAGRASPELIEEFSQGEGFKASPELTIATFRTSPRIDPYPGYLEAKPLSDYDEPPEAVIFLVNALGLSALTILTNFARASWDNVILPFASGCASVALYPLSQIKEAQPKATVGLTDISARLTLKPLLGHNFISWSAPYSLFLEMEENVPKSFLSRRAWSRLTREDLKRSA